MYELSMFKPKLIRTNSTDFYWTTDWLSTSMSYPSTFTLRIYSTPDFYCTTMSNHINRYSFRVWSNEYSSFIEIGKKSDGEFWECFSIKDWWTYCRSCLGRDVLRNNIFIDTSKKNKSSFLLETPMYFRSKTLNRSEQ